MIFCCSHRLVPSPVLVIEASPSNGECFSTFKQFLREWDSYVIFRYLFVVWIVSFFFPLNLSCCLLFGFCFSVCLCFVLFYERGFLCVAYTDLKPMTLSQPLTCWLYRQETPRPFFFCVNRSLHIAILIHKHLDELFIGIIINILMHTNLIYINYY